MLWRHSILLQGWIWGDIPRRELLKRFVGSLGMGGAPWDPAMSLLFCVGTGCWVPVNNLKP